MNISFSLYNKAPPWWDEEIIKNKGMFASSSLWAKFHEELGIARGRYLEVFEGKKRVMLLLFCDMLAGGHFLLFIPKPLLRVLYFFPPFRTFYFYLQPVFVDKNVGQDEKVKLKISVKVLDYLLDLAKKENKSISPCVYLVFNNIKDAQKLAGKFGQSFKLAATTRLALTSESELNAKFPQDVRWKISKGERSGVEVEFLKEKEALVYIRGLEESHRSYKFRKYSSVYDKVLKKMYPENIKHLVVMQNGKVLNGSILMLYGKTIMEGAYITPYGRELKMPSGELLKWTIIKYGIENGYKLMEFNMIDVSDNGDEEKTKKISNFKLKWGGDIIYGVEIRYLNWFLRVVKGLKGFLKFLPE